MHYRKILFTRGAKHFHPYKKRAVGSHMVHHRGTGVHQYLASVARQHYGHHPHHGSGLDQHLLSLIKGVSLHSKGKKHMPPPKTFHKKKYGGALRFTR